jgi:short-subunit dehydrogenase
MGKERALITGGSVGIGAALAEVFAAHGHDVILTSSNRDKLEARGRAIRERFNIDVVCLAEDLGDPSGARRLHETVIGRGLDVHYLVNNAGIGQYGKFESTDLDVELKMIQINTASLVDLTKRFLPPMIQRKSGRILNLASTAAFVPGPWSSVYYATKAFVLSFSQAIEYELRPHGITVTALCPGPTESEFKVRAGSQRSRLFENMVMPAEPVAQLGYSAMMKGQAVVIPGARNKLVPIAARLMPRPLVAMLAHRAARPSEDR